MAFGPNPVGSLQEYCVTKRIEGPQYSDGEKCGTEHCPTFCVWCSVLNFVECGNGSTKREAKKNAANKILSLIYANEKITPKKQPRSYCEMNKRQKQSHDEVVVADRLTERIEGTLGTPYDNNIKNINQSTTWPINIGNANEPLTAETTNNDVTINSLENIHTGVEMKCVEQSDNEKYPNSKGITQDDIIEKVKREIRYEVVNLRDCIAEKKYSVVMEPVCELMNLCKTFHFNKPEYEQIFLTSTPDQFTVCCTVNEDSVLGNGPRKQSAKVDAATNMLKFLKTKLGLKYT